MTRIELFDTDRDTEALARFDELAAERATTVHVTNAATRAIDRWADAWEAHDWQRIAAVFVPEFRLSDRRTLVYLELDRDQHLESLRAMFEMSSCRFPSKVLATRGERLALARARFEGADRSIGPSEVEFLFVLEVNDHGDRVAVVMFDPDDLDAAHAELDERYAAGEAAPHAAGWRESLGFWRALAARDWEQLAAGFAPGFVLEDHRPLGLLASLSGDEYVASVRALLELRPDATLRLVHVLAIEDRRLLAVGRWAGGEPEGAFEIPVVNVSDFGPDGSRHWHFYNLDQLDEAWACYEALRPAPLRPPPNQQLGTRPARGS